MVMSTLARVTLVFSQSKKLTCGLDFEAFDDWTQGTLEDAAQAAYDTYNGAAGLKTQYPSSLILDHVEAFAYDIAAIAPVPPEPPLYHRVPTLGPYGSTGAPIAGTNAATGGQAPPNVALVYSFYTAVLARRGRGRIYTPAPGETAIDSAGEVDPTFLAALTADWLALIEAIEAAPVTIAPVEHVVASMTYNEVNVVTSYKMRDRVDTQRRRLIRSIDT